MAVIAKRHAADNVIDILKKCEIKYVSVIAGRDYIARSGKPTMLDILASNDKMNMFFAPSLVAPL